jgi:G3E family GTPase
MGRERIAFHVVTGFLGAGKTTLINRLLRAPELADALVIVNEWGDIGLDHLLYERLSSDAILIGSGCVCCALRGDLLEALRDALARSDSGALPPFGRIVLETTGLAEPAPILHALFADPALTSRLGLAGVKTLVDSINGRATQRSRPQSARQVALADRLVIAKSDLLPSVVRGDRLAELRSTLRDLNPLAPMFDGAAEETGFDARRQDRGPGRRNWANSAPCLIFSRLIRQDRAPRARVADKIGVVRSLRVWANASARGGSDASRVFN